MPAVVVSASMPRPPCNKCGSQRSATSICRCSCSSPVKIAGTRWKIEDDFQDSKSTASLDQTQVRCYRAWKRHVTLAMAALAFLAAVTAIEEAAHPPRSCPSSPISSRRPIAAPSR